MTCSGDSHTSLVTLLARSNGACSSSPASIRARRALAMAKVSLTVPALWLPSHLFALRATTIDDALQGPERPVQAPLGTQIDNDANGRPQADARTVPHRHSPSLAFA